MRAMWGTELHDAFTLYVFGLWEGKSNESRRRGRTGDALAVGQRVGADTKSALSTVRR